jgi:hypothetical protein
MPCRTSAIRHNKGREITGKKKPPIVWIAGWQFGSGIASNKKCQGQKTAAYFEIHLSQEFCLSF